MNMEWARIIWIVNFFFLALILIFIWSKILIISRRIASVTGIVKEIDDIPISHEAPPDPETLAKKSTK